MEKPCTIDRFFKRKNASFSEVNADNTSLPTSNVNILEKPPIKSQKIDVKEIDIGSLERDLRLRIQIWDYHVNQRDEIRRAYIKAGPYQPILSKYPKSGSTTHLRSFQLSWFKLFPSWLEYSPAKDAAFCLPYFLFYKPCGSGYYGQQAFTIDGFQNWKKVRDGEKCAFLNHIGKDLNSFHNVAKRSCEDLINQFQHIQKVLDNFTSEQIVDNRLRLKVSIDTIRLLAFQGCAFRHRDERPNSINRGNFLQIVKLLGSYNDNVAKVLDKAPKNASYTSPKIQKEILHIFSIKVKNAIREEIGDVKYCIIVDEAHDESKKEQMAIVLRFVDKDGFVRERFFGLIHVSNTTASTLKDGIYSVLSHQNLDIQNIRGQGYDGASNMQGEWKGLQALVLNDCPYAYYIHCFAHHLQLALVATSKDVIPIHKFFLKLAFVVNIVGASCKRNDELKVGQAAEIEHMIDIDELETAKGLNQIGTLQRAGDTRWSSHFKSVSSLIKIFSPTCEVLLNIINEGATSAQRGDANSAYEILTSFEFVFILHLMKEMLEITDLLCHALQCQSQDILNAMNLVSSTKALLQKFRDDKWDALLANVQSFCEVRNIDVPNMNAPYIRRRGRARDHQDDFTVEHYYRVDIFYAAIDSQLQELNGWFSEHAVELLNLSSALDPRDMSETLRIDDICQLVENFYLQDFKDQEKIQLRMQLHHYEHNVVQHVDYKKLSTISELCQWLVRTNKSTIYQLVYRVITLVLTLPVSTATTERSFSAMKIVKSRLRNKIEDEFLTDSLLVYIEKEIAENFTTESIIEDFRDMKDVEFHFNR
ncbi:zinc finger MYM-type protein 1-like [Camellia sinensis]|uniref:zinc finger MYM-type protein 1-like n=1 Tax=Camellia sinensis TaxID=4442 RepID=UPI001035A18B|nr:zinc finger MYM-type protein 1-like [Camellia sinensis]